MNTVNGEYYSCQQLRKKDTCKCPCPGPYWPALSWCCPVLVYTLALSVSRICRSNVLTPFYVSPTLITSHHKQGTPRKKKKKPPDTQSSTSTSKTFTRPPPYFSTPFRCYHESRRDQTRCSPTWTHPGKGGGPRNRRRGWQRTGDGGTNLNPSIHPTCFFVCSCVFIFVSTTPTGQSRCQTPPIRSSVEPVIRGSHLGLPCPAHPALLRPGRRVYPACQLSHLCCLLVHHLSLSSIMALPSGTRPS